MTARIDCIGVLGGAIALAIIKLVARCHPMKSTRTVIRRISIFKRIIVSFEQPSRGHAEEHRAGVMSTSPVSHRNLLMTAKSGRGSCLNASRTGSGHMGSRGRRIGPQLKQRGRDNFTAAFWRWLKLASFSRGFRRVRDAYRDRPLWMSKRQGVPLGLAIG